MTSQTALLENIYSAQELKGIIKLCKNFIGSLIHPTGGALYLEIPTMTHVYNRKTIGINGEVLGQHDYLVSVASITGSLFTALFLALASNDRAFAGQKTRG